MSTQLLYSVENHIPIPPQRSRQSKYPFRKLEVGQSFFVPCDPVDIGELWNSLTSCRGHMQRATGRKFTMRQTDYRKDFGIRVWRVS